MSAPQPSVDDGLLFVYGESGPQVPEEEFNDWGDKHAPARLAVPGISTALRYKAVDGKTPTWLAIYDTTTPDVLESDEYKALSVNAPENEKSIISRLAILNRRIYHRFETLETPTFDATSALPAPFVLVVGINPGSPEREEENIKWYSEEHLGLLSKVPGFIRARRYKLVSSVELAGQADPASPAVAFTYVTLYDWENATFANEPAFKHAISTPWSKKVLSEIQGAEQRVFGLHKQFT